MAFANVWGVPSPLGDVVPRGRWGSTYTKCYEHTFEWIPNPEYEHISPSEWEERLDKMTMTQLRAQHARVKRLKTHDTSNLVGDLRQRHLEHRQARYTRQTDERRRAEITLEILNNAVSAYAARCILPTSGPSEGTFRQWWAVGRVVVDLMHNR
jgi:hypothetical protein